MDDLQTDHVLGDIESQINDEVSERNQDTIKALRVLRNSLEELAMEDAYNNDLLSDEIYDINQAIIKMDAKLWRTE